MLVDEGRKVVATVADEPIRLQEFMDRVRELPFEERAKTNDADPSVRFAMRRAVLDGMITEKLLVKEAEAQGIVIPDEEVEAIIEQEREHERSITGPVEGESGAHEHHAHGEEPTHGEIVEKRHELMRTRLLDKTLSEDAVLRYYEEHPAEFKSKGPMVNCELVVADAKNAAVIDEIYQKARKNNSSLREALASIRGSSSLLFAGITPLSPLNRLAPEMKESVEKLDVGEISQPFYLHPQGMEHYAVARLVEKTDIFPFVMVKKQLQDKLRKEFFEGLQKKFNVVYNDDVLHYRVGQ
jgi:hypothetical protein